MGSCQRPLPLKPRIGRRGSTPAPFVLAGATTQVVEQQWYLEVLELLDLHSVGLPPALAAAFGQVENAHQRLARRVQGMGQEELEFLGAGGNRNSTATLLAHIALTDRVYLRCIMGEVVPDTDPVLGPYEDAEGNLPTVTGVPVADLLARGQMVVEMARDYLRTCTIAEAERAVTVPWWPEQATVRYVLWHMASHNMFHQGQIARLQAQYKQG